MVRESNAAAGETVAKILSSVAGMGRFQTYKHDVCHYRVEEAQIANACFPRGKLAEWPIVGNSAGHCFAGARGLAPHFDLREIL